MDESSRTNGRYTRGYLPHLRVPGRSYFVTFRLAGTLPQTLLKQWQEERARVLAEVGRLEAAVNSPTGMSALPRVSPAGRQRGLESRLMSERVERYLDAGRGECWLRDDRIASVVRDAMRHFNGERDELGLCVIMAESCPRDFAPVRGPFVG